MYNLFVANTSEEWNGDPFILQVERCISVREYTDKKIAEKYGVLSLAQIDEIIQFPCIFAYETQCHKNPKFGYIYEIVKRQGKVKIHYEIIHLDKFLTHSELEEMHFELDIHGWEYNRTHWAIKDVNLQKELIAKEINLPQSLATKHAQSIQRLRVFLCHSSGDKSQVRGIYKHLTAKGIQAWLDEESLLAGQDWELEISRAIRSTHVVIVCLSQNSTNKKGYVQKEIKFALDEADKQPEGTIYIIPVKVEECDLPDRLQRYHTLNLFEERGFEKLLDALRSRAYQLGFTLPSI